MAGRYASALFDLATEQNAVRKTEADLVQIGQLIESSGDLLRLVKSPVFTSEEQSRALDALMRKAGVDGLTLNFLKLITRNRRLFALPGMITAFRALSAQARGEVQAEVTSAHPLAEPHMQALRETLKAGSGGKQIQIATKVDPALLGGLVVKIGSRMIDSSLRTRLDNLKIAMKEVR